MKCDGELIIDKSKAEVLNKQYQSQFTIERSKLPTELDSDTPSMPDIKIGEEGAIKLLEKLNPNKASGPDDILPRFLQLTAHELGPALSIVFQHSLDTGDIPQDWRCANITPIFKKGDRTKPGNYHSVNLPSVCCKISFIPISCHTWLNTTYYAHNSTVFAKDTYVRPN